MDLNINALRREIDRIDNNLLQMLQKRIEVARLIVRFKKEQNQQVNVPSREKEILDSLMGRERSLLSAEVIKDIYETIFTECKRIQVEEKPLVAFQGEHGAFSEMAARQWNSGVVPIPCAEFTDIFQGVSEGSYEYGIVPIENTAGGIVSHVNGALRNSDPPLYIVGAVEMSVHHCLMIPPGTDHRNLRRVYSHPAALAECSEFIKRMDLEPIQYFDTAGAAKMLAEDVPEASAAIAGELAARYYNLDILMEGIGNEEHTRTRFVVISRTPYSEQGNKCSLVFSIPDKAGALFSILKLFADANINLTRIDSVPDETSNFAFFVDFAASDQVPEVQEILQEIERKTLGYRFLGCYREL
ncbi:MAG: prephenate dehydratase domain-containing protein [Planctomycetia bacterium]|nr:prephenate dehydratase domain-containing protein [Planctomycetia bacterium]